MFRGRPKPPGGWLVFGMAVGGGGGLS